MAGKPQESIRGLLSGFICILKQTGIMKEEALIEPAVIPITNDGFNSFHGAKL